MAQLSIKKLLATTCNKETNLSQLILELDPSIYVVDPHGRPVLGESTSRKTKKKPSDHDRVPISVEGNIIGWVEAGYHVHTIASLLDLIGSMRAENRALSLEVLDRYRELNLIHNLSESLAATPEPEPVAQAVLEQVAHMVHASAAVLLIATGNSPATEDGFTWKSMAALGPSCTIQDTAWEKGGFLHDVLYRGRSVLVNEVPACELIHCFGESPVSVISAALHIEDRLMGAIVLVSEPTHQYNAGELKLLNTIALQVAPAIEIAQLHAIAIEKARMERELQMAREVQADLLPVRMPNREGWEFCAVWKPAREVSGDYYDFIEETNNQLGMVIADVSDKGLPAALMMVFARSALRASIGGRNTPTQAVAGANRLISSASHKGYFVTMVYARLDTQSGQICYVNAGHNPAIWYHKQNGRFNTFGRTGLPLGLSRQERYEQSIVQLNEGDFVLFYTDGVIDATDKNNQPFTTEHLNDVIYENRNSSAQEIVEAIAEAVGEHSGSDTLLDDVTMSIVKRL